LDGLPLALELAAAKVRFLPPPLLLARLAHRLDLLAGGWRDLPPRQQSLQAAIEWSYDLLDPGDQLLFRRLAVFAGGATFPAVDGVCGGPPAALDAREGLSTLVEQSLVQETGGADGEPCYRMLETIREFALERLEASGEADAVRAAHARFYLALAEEARPELRGPAQAAWVARLAAEQDNLRAVLAWSLDGAGDVELGARLAGALWMFWYYRAALDEGRRWLETAVARRPGAADAVQADALNGAGALAISSGEAARASTLFAQSLALRRRLGDTQGIAASVNNLGMVAEQLGDYARAEACYAESVELERTLGNTSGVATSLANRGGPAYFQGQYARARAFYAESLQLYTDLHDTQAIARTLCNLGQMAWAEGDYASARAASEESLAQARALGNTLLMAWALVSLGRVAHECGDAAGAIARLEEALVLFRQAGYQPGLATVLFERGQVALDQGDHQQALAGFAASLAEHARAASGAATIADELEGVAQAAGGVGHLAASARLAGAVAALRERSGAATTPVRRARCARRLAELRALYGPAAWDAAWDAGRHLTQEEVLAEVRRLAPPSSRQ
ncbi:MAG TPA: tetratricopeptide repeat protein, partial [Chloroflexia bacterium]|nr:tetratricopeptide repeat protein [Chloroflexia bacterium]